MSLDSSPNSRYSPTSRCPVSLPSLSEPLSSIDSASVCPLSPPGDSSSGATSHTRKISRRQCKKRKKVCNQGEDHGYSTTISLPDNVLLEIFDFYRNSHDHTLSHAWKWHILVHVCQRWRQVVFASPHRLNLKILCTYGTPVRKKLRIWPAFPIVIHYNDSLSGISRKDTNNVLTALKHRDRVYSVRLVIMGSQWEKIAMGLQEPFPALTHLDISTVRLREYVPILPAEFLGGSASCLQEITLSGIPLPTLPALLLSASDLVALSLRNIPPTDYIPPEAMVACLAALPRLETLHIGFRPPIPSLDRMPPPLVTRTVVPKVLPTLSYFEFQGTSEYLDDLISQIDSPQLDQIVVVYHLNWLVDFQVTVTELSKFVDRTGGPKSTPFKHAHVAFLADRITFDLYDTNDPHRDGRHAKIVIPSFHWRVSHMALVLSHFFATFTTVVHLKLKAELESYWQLEAAEDRWQSLLRQFSTVQTLSICQILARGIARTLENIPEEIAEEVLPSVDLICLQKQRVERVEKFVTIRRLSGRPITVVDTKAEFDQRLRSLYNVVF